jgi:hypothetical protein
MTDPDGRADDLRGPCIALSTNAGQWCSGAAFSGTWTSRRSRGDAISDVGGFWGVGHTYDLQLDPLLQHFVPPIAGKMGTSSQPDGLLIRAAG